MSDVVKTTIYGRPVETDGVPDLYEGTRVVRWSPPPSGIDNLGLHSWGTFAFPGVGEFDIEFDGYVRVVRSEPTDEEWVDAEVYTNLIEMKLVGESEDLGTISAALNPECLSAGQIRAPFDPHAVEGPAAKVYRMAVGCLFDIPKLGKTLFNREPLILTIDDVQSIPPVGAPGNGQIYRMLPFYDTEDPWGEPLGYLTRLTFTMGGYLPPSKVG